MDTFEKMMLKKEISTCLERKNKIAIKSSKRFYRCHVYEIELKKDKALNDFTYLIGKARSIFYYLYSLEKSKGKLDVLFKPVVSAVWKGKLTFKDEPDYVGPIFSGFLLPTFSLETFFSNFNSLFLELVNSDNIVNHNCENIKVFLSFLEQSYICKRGMVLVNGYDRLTSIDYIIEGKYLECEEIKPKEDEHERQVRADRETQVKLYKKWKKINNIDEEDEEDNKNVMAFYEEYGYI